MKKMIAAAIALSLAGCAGMPRPQVNVAPHKAQFQQKSAPTPKTVETPAAPATFKKRWYSRFKVHPKWFH